MSFSAAEGAGLLRVLLSVLLLLLLLLAHTGSPLAQVVSHGLVRLIVRRRRLLAASLPVADCHYRRNVSAFFIFQRLYQRLKRHLEAPILPIEERQERATSEV